MWIICWAHIICRYAHTYYDIDAGPSGSSRAAQVYSVNTLATISCAVNESERSCELAKVKWNSTSNCLSKEASGDPKLTLNLSSIDCSGEYQCTDGNNSNCTDIIRLCVVGKLVCLYMQCMASVNTISWHIHFMSPSLIMRYSTDYALSHQQQSIIFCSSCTCRPSGIAGY